MSIIEKKSEIINSAQNNELSLLRFITCGSVDDGKSTLIGRMLFDAGQIFDDQLDALEDASEKFGTQGKERDYALLVDGLSAEREQGITIDVAYRYFRTPKRAFIVADTPGHEQYTRNMATGASNAELAIILIDARKGVLPQTRRHALIVSLLGVKNVVLAINKMDLVDYSQEVFEAIKKDFLSHSDIFNFGEVIAIPMSAKNGENILAPSTNMNWYDGQSLLNHLETVQIINSKELDFHFPVQWVNRPNLDFRGFSGYVASGSIKKGQQIRVSSSGQTSNIARIVTYDGDIEEAIAGQSLTITLDDEIDISRGDILSSPQSQLKTINSFGAKILWMSANPMRIDKEYILKSSTSEINSRIIGLDNCVDFETLTYNPADILKMNGVGAIKVSVDKPLLLDTYQNNKELGAFILIDRITNETVALGLVENLNIIKPAPKQDLDNFMSKFLPNSENKKSIIDYFKSWLPISAIITFILILFLSKNIKLAFIAAILELCLKPFIQAYHYKNYKNKQAKNFADDNKNIDGYGI